MYHRQFTLGQCCWRNIEITLIDPVLREQPVSQPTTVVPPHQALACHSRVAAAGPILASRGCDSTEGVPTVALRTDFPHS